MNAERQRLENQRQGIEPWDLWGPYLSERAWGTVREDYSADGNAWDFFPHDHARSRVYRWNEDGLAGISDRLAGFVEAIERLIPGDSESLAEDLRVLADGLEPLSEQLVVLGDQLTTAADELAAADPALEALASRIDRGDESAASALLALARASSGPWCSSL